jgi:hypothetical protein
MTGPNDDLEQQLRDGLQRGPLPLAPDALRQRLAGLPMERTADGGSRFLSGLRLAGLTSAAAVALVFVIVVRSLPGPAGPGPSTGPSGLGTTSASPSPSASATPMPTPTASPTLSPTPAASQCINPLDFCPVSSPQMIQPSPAPGFTCAATTILPATTSAVTAINDVRVGTHAGYDRIVFQFAGAGRPRLTIAKAYPPFVEDASGQPVSVAGRAFLTLKLYDASGYPTYTGPNAFSPGYPRLTALVNNGDYEGYVSWVAGLTDLTCYRISTLTSPTRIVVDIQAP